MTTDDSCASLPCTANFRSVYMNCGALGGAQGCERRLNLTREELPAIRQSNMDPIGKAKFVCKRCGSKQVRAYIPPSEEMAAMFLAGDPMPRVFG